MDTGRMDGVLGMRHYSHQNPTKEGGVETQPFKLEEEILLQWSADVLSDLAKCIDNKFDSYASFSFLKEKYGIESGDATGPILYLTLGGGVDALKSSNCAGRREYIFEMAAFHWLSSILPVMVAANESERVTLPLTKEVLFGNFLFWTLDQGIDLRASSVEIFEPSEHFGLFTKMLRTTERDRTLRAARKMAQAKGS